MKAFRRINTDRGYNEPKLRHHEIQIPEIGAMYVAVVDVYLRWRIKRTIRGSPQKTLKSASLDVAEKATTYLKRMQQREKHVVAEKIIQRFQNQQIDISGYSEIQGVNLLTTDSKEREHEEANTSSIIMNE